MSSSPDADLLVRLLPRSSDQIKRLLHLSRGARAPVVTVLGKYNHGKSKLLNELIGRDVFKVADARQTVKLEAVEEAGVRWLDAPGLDADVRQEDDRLAAQSAWLEADVRLFVHSAKEGEFDVKEQALLQQLRDDQKRSGRSTVIVLTMIEQLDEAQLQQVLSVMKRQAPDFEILPVSSIRHQKGREEGKPVMMEKSGFAALRQRIAREVGQVAQKRAQETQALNQALRQEILRLTQAADQERVAAQQRRAQIIGGFEGELRQLVDEVRATLQAA